MAARDPQTGKFVSSGAVDRFDDIEQVQFSAHYGVQASDLSGSTGFTGEGFDFADANSVIDYDEIVDRNESLHLIQAMHVLNVYANSTQTADGSVAAAVALTTSPTRQTGTGNLAMQNASSVDADTNVIGQRGSDDSIDPIGRQLIGFGGAPFSDSSGGEGGAGSAGEDRVVLDGLPGDCGRFHPRDDLFAVGEFAAWNIDDAAIHAEISGQHIYGVLDETC